MANKRDLISSFHRMKLGAGIKGSTFLDTNHDSPSARYGYNLAIDDMIAMVEKMSIDSHPDTEADGYVFCGKCGKMQTI